MTQFVVRDVAYRTGDTEMLGMVIAAAGAASLPGAVLLHDAFGLGPDMVAVAKRYASLGLSVFAADIWGARTTPTDGHEIGPLIGGMVHDRSQWMARVKAAHVAAAAQEEIDPEALVSIGYCFGGSSALEHLRTTGGVRGVVSIHGGLDLLEQTWSEPRDARVLVCTGASDPMATPEQRLRLEEGLTSAGVDWELDLYSGAQHAFTNPKSDLPGMPPGVGYHPRSAARAWQATERFLGELFPEISHPAA